MKKQQFIILVLLMWTGLQTTTAQIKGKEFSVMVSPDHKDWNYKLREQCEFTVSVYDAQNLLEGAVVDYELGPVMYPEQKKQSVTLKSGKTKLKGTMKAPGYYRCKVWAHVGERTYEGLATVAYAPEKIEPATQLPADFKAYWENNIKEAQKVPLDYHTKLLPERCTETVNVYEVDFQNEQWGSRIYGILCMPKKEGSYPALLRVPGAGVRPYSGDVYTASKGAITLEIGIHGVPVTMEQNVYDRLADGALREYYRFNTDNPASFYYRRVILGVIRSIDFIDQLPQFNHKALAVTGSSQGGALSIIAAALDRRVTCFAAVHPALCDHEGHLKGRSGGWPHYYYYDKQPSQKTIDNLRHYDVVNFARLLTVPGWFSWGYNDEVCPPTSMQAAYNSIKAQKKFRPYLQTGHWWYQEQWDEWCEWIWKQMGL